MSTEGRSVSPADLASGWLDDLNLDPAAVPREPFLVVDLDAACRGDIERAAMMARSALPLLIGVAHRPIPERLLALVRALSLTIAPDAVIGRAVVPSADVDAEASSVCAAVRRHPDAALALAHLLRRTERDEVRDGLTAEAATYSMLLKGREFRRWLQRRGARRPRDAKPRDPVTVERSGSILRLTLRRPERRNAMNIQLRDALVDALELAAAAAETRVELRGDGPDFCSGGDLDEFGLAEDPVGAYMVRLQRHPGWRLHLVSGRTTAFLNGACIGAGIEIGAFAGRVVATGDAYFRLPEVEMGLIPGAGGTVSIPRRIGRWRTAWMAITNARVDVPTALRWGLVDAVA